MCANKSVFLTARAAYVHRSEGSLCNKNVSYCPCRSGASDEQFQSCSFFQKLFNQLPCIIYQLFMSNFSRFFPFGDLYEYMTAL